MRKRTPQALETPEGMATRPISDGLKVEESARLLHAIFPDYPAIYPCRPAPPREEWPDVDNFQLATSAQGNSIPQKARLKNRHNTS